MNFLAYIRQHTTDAEWSKFCEVWTRSNTSVPCPFVEAVTFFDDDFDRRTWRVMSPIIGTRSAEEVRGLASIARAMRCTPWWDAVPEPSPHLRGIVWASNAHDDGMGYRMTNSCAGEINA